MTKKKNTEEEVKEEVVEEKEAVVEIAESSTPATRINTSSNAYE